MSTGLPSPPGRPLAPLRRHLRGAAEDHLPADHRGHVRSRAAKVSGLAQRAFALSVCHNGVPNRRLESRRAPREDDTMASADADRNLLFGVIAMQADAITRAQFVDACALWANQKERALADLLVERGWLAPSDREDVERLFARKLKRHGGDARASLAELIGDALQQSPAQIGDPEVRRSLGLPDAPAGHVIVSTIGYQPETRERYTLTRLHAQGGIGQVWLARDQALGREVALKELRPERAASPAVWARFLEEAKVTGQLEHPGIVPVYELAARSEDRQPFYTMRFVRGRTLAEAVRDYYRRRSAGEAGAVEFQGLLQALVGVCNAVAYAHARGVLHRDLKPQNVVLGDYGEVIVLDWGLAKLVGRPED